MGWIHYLAEQRGAVRVPACGVTYPGAVLADVRKVDCERCMRTKLCKQALRAAEVDAAADTCKPQEDA